jgi:hypothetical protein
MVIPVSQYLSGCREQPKTRKLKLRNQRSGHTPCSTNCHDSEDHSVDKGGGARELSLLVATASAGRPGTAMLPSLPLSDNLVVRWTGCSGRVERSAWIGWPLQLALGDKGVRTNPVAHGGWRSTLSLLALQGCHPVGPWRSGRGPSRDTASRAAQIRAGHSWPTRCSRQGVQ